MCSLACVCPMAHVCPLRVLHTCKSKNHKPKPNQNKKPQALHGKQVTPQAWEVLNRRKQMFWVLFSLRGWQEVYVGLVAPSERTWPSSGHRGIRSSGLDSCHPSAGNIWSWHCEDRTHLLSLKGRIISVLLHTVSHPHTAQHTLLMAPH